ncbi:uncharacterized protein LOC114481994 [Gouania willdenowi]|uniref:uncharacterized protein LOC114481994 n=1 Tax=Gouania willdenowi TaxID=441366 RepID=UPI001055FDB9|nr:uncharacterized protein LOC114481994 [Gouania willdenowi]
MLLLQCAHINQDETADTSLCDISSHPRFFSLLYLWECLLAPVTVFSNSSRKLEMGKKRCKDIKLSCLRLMKNAFSLETFFMYSVLCLLQKDPQVDVIPTMTSVVNIFQYIVPILAVSIAAVLLCFYLHTKKKRSSYDVSTPSQEDTPSVLRTVSLSEDQAAVDRCYDGVPPRYSTVEAPPPYSLFDPKLTNVWPGGPSPAFEMYPITLPLAPHFWSPARASPEPTSVFNHIHRPQRPRRASST